jgi:hypothetical protein
VSEHPNLTAALAAAQAEYPTILKGSVNPHFKSTYADLADGMGPIRPILAKHGIAYTQTFHVVDGILILRTSLRHGAETVDSELPITQPPKPQDFIALTTYYRRVGLFAIAGITPANEDDDGEAANKVATTQAPPRQPQPPKREPLPPLASPEAEVKRALGQDKPPVALVLRYWDEGEQGTYEAAGKWLSEYTKLYAETKKSEPVGIPDFIRANWATLRMLHKKMPEPFAKAMQDAMVNAPSDLITTAEAA